MCDPAEDAANEIVYLYKRKYPISWIEMGEEADGQRVLPEDYATLYIQFAKAIHKLTPSAPLGGPAFEGTPGDVDSWADANGRVSFLGRFVGSTLKRAVICGISRSSHSSSIPAWEPICAANGVRSTTSRGG